ncbi:MAG: hydroxyphenylacetyl-CoA thioesterase PaaI [Candidatus Aquilonibacter sp.]
MIDDAQALAERCAQAMFARDRASQAAGMTIDAVAPGYAKLSMTLLSEMINGHQTAHGGAIFTLADSAFAFACNSRNVASVAQHCSITYVTAGREGERLTVECRETNLTGRFGVYDATVSAGDGRVVALFRGYSAAVRGNVLDGKEPW